MASMYTYLYEQTIPFYWFDCTLFTNQNSENLIIQLKFVGCSYKLGQVVGSYPPSIILSLG